MEAEEITEGIESDKHDDEGDSVPIFEDEGGSSEAEGSSPFLLLSLKQKQKK